jgi:type IV secretory pathway VirB10-like protein
MSQALLNPSPMGARGVRRLNRWPAVLGLVVVIIVVVTVAYTFRQRMERQEADRAAADTSDVSGAGKRAKNLFPDEAQQKPPPHTAENMPPPAAVAIPPPPIDLAEVARMKQWDVYFQKVQQHTDEFNDRQAKALAAATLDSSQGTSINPAPSGSAGDGQGDLSGGGTGGGAGYPGGVSGLPSGGIGLPPGLDRLGAGINIPGQQPAGVDREAQAEKRAFFDQSGDLLGKNEDLRGSVHGPKWNTVMEGTAIPGVMLGGLTSDMPGMVVAQVTQNVYDSAGMLPADQPLIPQGTRLVGRYDNSVSYGQQRVGVVWNRMIFPDSSSRQLGSMQGADSEGYSGFYDIVNTHFWDKFWAATIISIAGAAAQLSQPQQSAFQGYSPASVAAASMTQGYSQLGEAYARAGLAIPNTLEIRPGYLFVFMVNKDIHLPVYVDHRNGGGQHYGVVVR